MSANDLGYHGGRVILGVEVALVDGFACSILTAQELRNSRRARDVNVRTALL